MAKRHPEYQANLERALTNLFTFSPESAQRISPFREILEEKERNTKREVLILLLESKFGPLSRDRVSQINAISNVDELTRMCKLVLGAQTLEQIGL